MTDTATLETRLAEVETALHDLSMGASVASVRLSDGKTIEYRATSIGDLRAYRDNLRRQLNLEPLGARIRRVIVG